MLANHILQKTLQDIHRIVGLGCSLWNLEGSCLAESDVHSPVIEEKVVAYMEVAEEKNQAIDEDVALFLVRDANEPSCILAFHGVTEAIEMAGRLGVSQLESLMQAYRGRVDKNQFYHHVLMEQWTPLELQQQAKKLGIETEQTRAVFVIESEQQADKIVVETLKGIYASRGRDVILSVDEGRLVLLKTLGKAQDLQAVDVIARELVATINTEAMVRVRVAYGTVAEELKEVARAYREAQMALEIGRTFYSQKYILPYNQLGIGRLIYELPISLCETFLEEVFGGHAVEQLDEETLALVNRFFETNLNISETARKLYIHRNTLVYRLEKIQKMTGLDVRVFEDALTFKIALMVSAWMKTKR